MRALKAQRRRAFAVSAAAAFALCALLLVPAQPAYADIAGDVNDWLCGLLRDCCNWMFKAQTGVLGSIGANGILSADFAHMLTSSSDLTMHDVARGVWQVAILPIGCGVLGLVFTLKLIEISQRMDGSQSLPGVKEVVFLLVFFAVFLFLIQNSFDLMASIYEVCGLAIDRVEALFGAGGALDLPEASVVTTDDDIPSLIAMLVVSLISWVVVLATTKNYNRLFTSLILNEVKDAEALRKALEANDEATTYMPGDAEVRAAFEESCLYNLQSKGVLYLLDSAIRPGMSSTALLGFNQYTLEHMMPKKWRNKWGALDDEAATRRDRKLLTLGNLAIITHSLNASIRDADWPTKKQGKGYKDGLALCAAGLATMAGALEKESWNEGDIADRAEWLADKALEVWR